MSFLEDKDFDNLMDFDHLFQFSEFDCFEDNEWLQDFNLAQFVPEQDVEDASSEINKKVD